MFVNPSILVVDDDQEFLLLMHAILHRLDYRVEYAGGGREALEKIAASDFAVILLDVIMPEVDGLDVIRKMAASRPSLLARTIVVTAAGGESLRELDRWPVYAVVRKPFDLGQLMHTIGNCAGLPGAERAGGPLDIISHVRNLAVQRGL